MSELFKPEMKNLNLKELYKEGEHIYKSNGQLQNFANVISHPEFRKFFKDNFSNWEDSKFTIMILKTAYSISEKYKRDMNTDIPGYILVALLKRTLEDPITRQEVVSQIMDSKNKLK
jgi:hypothetical protein